MSKRVDLTAAVTMHNEGVLAHKTMRSVFEALEKVSAAGYSFEILVHIDNGDMATKKYISRYENDKRIVIYENKFGDPGASRNFVVDKANGKYVAFLDGDDLISDNWYLESIKMLEKSKEEAVVHPEAILTFGIEQPNILTLQKDSFEKEKDTIILLGENRWGSVTMAKKETFKKVPYRVLQCGYSHEDYVFNIETTQLDIKHIVARGTILFYRRSEKSRLSVSNQNNATIPYVKLFDFNKVRVNEDKVEISKKQTLKNKGYKLYKQIRGNDFLNFFITPVAKLTLKVLNREPAAKRKIPDFVKDEWVKINHIDSQLYPYKWAVNNVMFYSAENQSVVGECYRKIARFVTRRPDYIFIVPWIVRGGADKVLFNYIKAMKESKPDWNFLVISTLAAKNTWAKDLPEYVDYVDFGRYASGLTPIQMDNLLTRVIIQTQCKNIHIINAEYGYEWAREHKELLDAEYNLTVSLFAYEYIPGSNAQAVYSYDNPCLFEIYNVVKSVFTDNEKIIDYAMEVNGFNENKFKVHYQPVSYKEGEVKNTLCEEGHLNILWASRVVPIKLPEIVAKIGRKIKKNVTIYVYGEMGADVDAGVFDGIDGVKYCGAYDGFNSLPIERMDAFLYTSLTDGMPNVILEAVAAGLPIIASDDGGVSEVVKDKKTGILIKDKFDVNEYVEAINWAFSHMDEMRRYAENAQKLLDEQHSWKKFVEVVKKDFRL